MIYQINDKLVQNIGNVGVKRLVIVPLLLWLEYFNIHYFSRILCLFIWK